VVDFRYHALSLVAVFLALGIGIVLGVTVGDSLVSEADQNLRD
jgi:copper transport outer membrane protein MctB